MEKALLVDHAKTYGRSRLGDFGMGMVRTIVEGNGTMQQVREIVKALREVQSDTSLPYNYADAQKAPTPIGATEKTELLNDSTTTWNLEANMRNEGVSNV